MKRNLERTDDVENATDVKKIKMSSEDYTNLNSQPREILLKIISYLNDDEIVPLISRNFRKAWKETPNGIVQCFTSKMRQYLSNSVDSLNYKLSFKYPLERIVKALFVDARTQQKLEIQREETEEYLGKLKTKLQQLDNQRFERLLPAINRITRIKMKQKSDYHHDTLIWYGGDAVVEFSNAGKIVFRYRHYVDSGGGYNDNSGDVEEDIEDKLKISQDDLLWIFNNSLHRTELYMYKDFKVEWKDLRRIRLSSVN